MLSEVGEWKGAQAQLEAARTKEQVATRSSAANLQAIIDFYQRHDPSKATRKQAQLLLASCSVEDLNVVLHTKYGEAPPLSASTFEFETSETAYLLGECHRRTDGEAMAFFELSLRMDEGAHGKEHVATARSLVGIAVCRCALGQHAETIEHCRLAIARIEAADCPSDHMDMHAEALQVIGAVHFAKAQVSGAKEDWQECLRCSDQSVRRREAMHGSDNSRAGAALSAMAAAYKHLGDPEKAIAINLRVVNSEEMVQGPLSQEAANTCVNLASGYENMGQYPEAAGWFKRASEANAFSLGPTHPDTVKCQWCLKRLLQRMDCTDAKTAEHLQFVQEAERALGRPLRSHCTKGHGLAPFINPSASDGCCDGCMNLIPQGKEVYGCRQCNFDLCGRCI
jgi:tetratricopeptide (TPR) repeat protein